MLAFGADGEGEGCQLQIFGRDIVVDGARHPLLGHRNAHSYVYLTAYPKRARWAMIRRGRTNRPQASRLSSPGAGAVKRRRRSWPMATRKATIFSSQVSRPAATTSL